MRESLNLLKLTGGAMNRREAKKRGPRLIRCALLVFLTFWFVFSRPTLSWAEGQSQSETKHDTSPPLGESMKKERALMETPKHKRPFTKEEIHKPRSIPLPKKSPDVGQ